jgi:hypothetical protein
VWLEDCGGAAPWIVDNDQLSSVGDADLTEVDAVRASGDCHPVIDSNLLITGGGEGGASDTTGVHCMASPGSSGGSQCQVIGNFDIEGSSFGLPPRSTGVRCDSGSCARIENNAILGHQGGEVWGLFMVRSGAMVRNNFIMGGCAPSVAVGVYAEDSWTRFENNIISSGGACNAADTTSYIGVWAAHAPATVGTGGEIDFHSNDVDALGDFSGCQSTSLLIDGNGAAGVYRNNIFRSGDCLDNVVVAEALDSADPRVFQHNDLDPYGLPLGLYYDFDTDQLLTSPAAVNALTDMDVHSNISADPQYVGFPFDLHIDASSPCIDVGTTEGAPALDMDGHPRDDAPDIGADEL